MKAPVLFLIAGLAIGAGVILVARPFGDGGASSDALAEATARIEALEGQLKEKGSGLDAPTLSPSPVAPEKPSIPAVEAKEEEKPAEVDPQAAIANLVNSKEARSLMKQAMSAFGNNSERFVSGMVGRYKDTLGLSDDQVASISKRLADNVRKQQAAFAEGLDNESKTVEELMREQGGGWQGQQQEEMEAILKEELTGDQFAQYEREQLVQQAQRVERQSQRELDRLNSKLELTETQQDQVFDTLVRTSPGYDESMQIEGVGQTAPATDVAAVEEAAPVAVGEVTPEAQEAARQEAIRAVLTPEQAAKYDEDLANPAPARGFGRGGFGGFGGFGGN